MAAALRFLFSRNGWSLVRLVTQPTRFCLKKRPESEVFLCRPVRQVHVAATPNTNIQNVRCEVAHSDQSKENELQELYRDIREALSKTSPELKTLSQYYLDGNGKAIRPVITMCMARAVNHHVGQNTLAVLTKQKKVAQVVEMIHTASLLHDDVIDCATSRRGKSAANIVWGQRKSVIAGDFVLGVATETLASLKNNHVTSLISQVLADLVEGEFMQLTSREKEEERFAHYIEKTYRKTASLIANGCQSVAVLAGSDDHVQSLAFQFGRQIGIAFQLVDDLLDFVATSAQLGKPAGADLSLGLATAPVLFASQKFPQLNALIMRRFCNPGDVETAFDLVVRSDGLLKTKQIAREYCDDAVRQLEQISPSTHREELVSISHQILHRMK